jgi:hypothetical protein
MPVRIFVDNGSEFSGRIFDLWVYHHNAAIDFNRPGKPTDNCSSRPSIDRSGTNAQMCTGSKRLTRLRRRSKLGGSSTKRTPEAVLQTAAVQSMLAFIA